MKKPPSKLKVMLAVDAQFPPRYLSAMLSAPNEPGHCMRCGKHVDGDLVTLYQDHRVAGEYHDFEPIPDDVRPFGNEFGPDCAKILRARAWYALGLMAIKVVRGAYRG